MAVSVSPAYYSRQTNFMYVKAPTHHQKVKREVKKAPYYPPLQFQPAGQAPPAVPYPPAPVAAAPVVPVYPSLSSHQAPPTGPPQPQEPQVAPLPPPGNGAWTAEQMEEAKQNSSMLFDAALNPAGKHRVRVTTFGPTVGIDIRDFMLGKYGELLNHWLPGKKGIRLTPTEWEALKAVSGDIDAALAATGWKPQAQ